MFQFVKYRLHDRSATKSPSGLSCGDDGLFIASALIIAKVGDVDSGGAYELRDMDEINLILTAAYDVEVDFTAKMPHLNLIRRYMNEGKWVLASISSVQLGLPDLPDEMAIGRVLDTDRILKSRRRRKRQESRRECTECSKNSLAITLKRDVSDEPRLPAGQAGGGEWEAGEGGSASAKPTSSAQPKPPSNPLLIPAQALAPTISPPIELPWFVPPTEITPFPISPTAPNIEHLNPTANPYPDRPKCVKEWADAIEFCRRQEQGKKLKPGYSGFGKNFQKCVLGMVSQDCGGNPTA